MQARVEFGLEHHHDGALDLDPGQTFKGGRGDFDVKMRLSAGCCARMTGMSGAVIRDF